MVGDNAQAPDTLLSYPYTISQDMASVIEASAVTILFNVGNGTSTGTIGSALVPRLMQTPGATVSVLVRARDETGGAVEAFEIMARIAQEPGDLPADQADSYIAGLILLAAAPCTAMVSKLASSASVLVS